MRARKVDTNHAEIRDGLRAAGVFVTDLSGCGRGVPDLLAANTDPAGWVLLEVKQPSERHRLTPHERTFIEAAWNRQAPVFVVTTLEEALAACGVKAAWMGE